MLKKPNKQDEAKLINLCPKLEKSNLANSSLDAKKKNNKLFHLYLFWLYILYASLFQITTVLPFRIDNRKNHAGVLFLAELKIE